MSDDTAPIYSYEDTLEVRRNVQELPYHRWLGLRLIDDEGRPLFRLPVANDMCSYDGYLHGGILYAMLDVGSTLPLFNMLRVGQGAMTISLGLSMLRPVLKGQTITVRGEVLKCGRRNAFVAARAYVVGEEESPVATAEVTKAIVPIRWPNGELPESQ